MGHMHARGATPRKSHGKKNPTGVKSRQPYAPASFPWHFQAPAPWPTRDIDPDRTMATRPWWFFTMFFTVQTRNDERAVQVLYGRRASLRGPRSGPACLGRGELTLGQQARGRARAEATGRLTQAPGCRWGQLVQWVHLAESRNSQFCVTSRGI